MNFQLLRVIFLSSLLVFTTQLYSQTSNPNSNTNTNNNNLNQSPLSDEMITNKINQYIKDSKTLSALNIQVSTQKGNVTLSGITNSDTQASAIIEFAQSLRGVNDIDTKDLDVKNSKQPLTDMVTTAKIKGLFVREELFGEKDIASINTSVETKNGVVYLSGVIDNQQQIQNAIDIIRKSIPEVKRVEYNVKKFIPFQKSTT
jgi:hyperosmotically inducible periplasmic protein